MNEFKTSSELIDYDFSSYKLSLQNLPVYRTKLPKVVDIVEPNKDQFSFLHHREFSLHNHLHVDVWNVPDFYYVGAEGKIIKIRFNFENNRVDGWDEVFDIPTVGDRTGGEFNISLCFVSPDICLVGDGHSTLYIINSNRRDAHPWTVVHSERLFAEKQAWSVVDGRVSPDGNELHCLVSHVQPRLRPHPKQDRASKFESVVQWIVLKQKDGAWEGGEMAEARCNGGLEYAAVEPSCTAVYLASTGALTFPHLQPPVAPPSHPEERNGDGVNGEGGYDYWWEQSWEEVRVRLAGEVRADLEEEWLTVWRGEEAVLRGRLHLPVSSHSSQGSEVVLKKAQGGTMWDRVFVEVEGGGGRPCRGKHVATDTPLPNLDNITSNKQVEGAAVLTDWQSEECDEVEQEIKTLGRYTLGNPAPTHQLVSDSQWLLKCQRDCKEAAAICVHVGCDGCVFQPCQPTEDKLWTPPHVSTFNAFGYIQASKRNKKFSICPQDACYVGVVESGGYVFLFRQAVRLEGTLKNRRTGSTVEHVALQHVVALERHCDGARLGDVLGAAAFPTHVFVLTNDALFSVHLDQPHLS